VTQIRRDAGVGREQDVGEELRARCARRGYSNPRYTLLELNETGGKYALQYLRERGQAMR